MWSLVRDIVFAIVVACLILAILEFILFAVISAVASIIDKAKRRKSGERFNRYLCAITWKECQHTDDYHSEKTCKECRVYQKYKEREERRKAEK